MAYWITRFGTVAIEPCTPAQEIGVPAVASATVRLPGGAYDALGSEVAPRAIPYSIRIRAEIVRSTQADMLSAWRALLALHGKRATLYRTPDGGAANGEWALARLVAVEAEREAKHLLYLPFEATFEVWSPVWYGTARDVQAALNTSPKTVTCANNGNARIANPVITITAQGSSITQVKIGVSGVSELQWAGTLAAGTSLVIDCGARSVKNNGADAYSGLTLTSNHQISDWLRLEPGDNSVVVTRTGGDGTSSVRFQYSDGWA